uniref:Uncharacterized protein n=1 Tax=Physcomitrium patens TaxID=3218 RepID=A0A7I4DMI1_PHYPA
MFKWITIPWAPTGFLYSCFLHFDQIYQNRINAQDTFTLKVQCHKPTSTFEVTGQTLWNSHPLSVKICSEKVKLAGVDCFGNTCETISACLHSHQCSLLVDKTTTELDLQHYLKTQQ